MRSDDECFEADLALLLEDSTAPLYVRVVLRARTLLDRVKNLEAERDRAQGWADMVNPTLIAERDAAVARADDLQAKLDEAQAEARKHELCNGGCVPGDAYRMVGDDNGRLSVELSEARAEVAQLRERIETLAALWKRRNRQLSEGYCSDQLRAVLAGDTGQRPEGPTLREVPRLPATAALDHCDTCRPLPHNGTEQAACPETR